MNKLIGKINDEYIHDNVDEIVDLMEIIHLYNTKILQVYLSLVQLLLHIMKLGVNILFLQKIGEDQKKKFYFYSLYWKIFYSKKSMN